MTDQQISDLWGELYTSVFARSRHPKLWAAMADLSTDEKHQIDLEAECILRSALD